MGDRAAEKMFGRSLRESIGFPALELVHPDDLELVLRSFESVRRKDVGTLIEVRASTPTGWRLLEVVGTPIEWPDEPHAVLFSMRDLTDRRRFEVARNKDATFRTVVHHSPDMTILLTRSGVVESVSGALSRILGHDPEAIEGQELAGFVVEADQGLFRGSGWTPRHAVPPPRDPLRVRIRDVPRDRGTGSVRVHVREPVDIGPLWVASSSRRTTSRRRSLRSETCIRVSSGSVVPSVRVPWGSC